MEAGKLRQPRIKGSDEKRRWLNVTMSQEGLLDETAKIMWFEWNGF
jgi:hypothetical protein